MFTLRLNPGMSEEFLKAYEGIRYEVAQGVPGHILDQVCQSPDDEDFWCITREWESLEDFLAWERTEEHRELVRPMREHITSGECAEEAGSEHLADLRDVDTHRLKRGRRRSLAP